MTRPSRGNASRTLALCALVSSLFLALPASVVRAATAADAMVDYLSGTPNYKNGDWVRYRIDAETSGGDETIQYKELRIDGEETYRGEKCFWLETGVGRDTTGMFRTLMLVSYNAFKDPYGDVRFKRYMRLFMMGPSLSGGEPEFMEVEAPKEDPPTPEELAQFRGKIDTLGTVSVETPRGKFSAREISIYRKLSTTEPRPDSTIQTITETQRKLSRTKRVPITSLARFEQTETTMRKAYAGGTVSTDAPELPIGWVKADARLVAWGTGATNAMLEAWRAQGGLIRAPETVSSP
jgi:hypothetical protein